MVECARLESACFRKGTGGSNPSLSASFLRLAGDIEKLGCRLSQPREGETDKSFVVPRFKNLTGALSGTSPLRLRLPGIRIRKNFLSLKQRPPPQNPRPSSDRSDAQGIHGSLGDQARNKWRALLRRIPRRDGGDAVGRSRFSRPKIILLFGV